MKNLGKGFALFFLMLAISAVIMIFIGGEEGSIQQGIAIAVASVVCYPISVKMDAVKPLKGLCIVLGVLLAIGATTGTDPNVPFASSIFALFGVAVTFILASLHGRTNKKP